MFRKIALSLTFICIICFLPPSPSSQEAQNAEVAKVFCCQCGQENALKSKFCKACGLPIIPIDPSRFTKAFQRDKKYLTQEEIQKNLQKASRSVVRIRMKTPMISYRRPYMAEGSLRSFYGSETVYIREEEKKTSEGAGSGFCISNEGYIVTNAHVAAPYTQNVELEVETSDGKYAAARLIGTDYATDLAVLKVEDLHLEPLAWVDSAKIATSEDVWAIGNPLDVGLSITKGNMSSAAKFRSGKKQIESFLSIDVKITGGNSGGPTVDALGQVVGVNTMAYVKEKEELNFCICSMLARKVVDAIIKGGVVRRSFLGLGLGPLDEKSKKRFNIPYKRGIVVEGLVPDSPAAKVGFQLGDLICGVNNQPTLTTIAFQGAIIDLPVGSRVQINFFRGDQLKEAYVITGERPPVPRIAPLDDLARHLDVQFKTNVDGKIMMTDLDPFGLAVDLGFKDNTVITKFFPAEFWEILDKAGKTIKDPGRPVKIDSLEILSDAVGKSYIFERIAFILEGKSDKDDIFLPLIIIENPMIIA